MKLWCRLFGHRLVDMGKPDENISREDARGENFLFLRSFKCDRCGKIERKMGMQKWDEQP